MQQPKHLSPYHPRVVVCYLTVSLTIVKTLKKSIFFTVFLSSNTFTSNLGWSAGILEEVMYERCLYEIKFREAEKRRTGFASCSNGIKKGRKVSSKGLWERGKTKVWLRRESQKGSSKDEDWKGILTPNWKVTSVTSRGNQTA